MLALQVLALFALIAGLAALFGRLFAEDPSEPALLWKLAGYGLLGLFTFSLNGIPFPVGYVIALILGFRASLNSRARLASATATFVLWLLGHLFG